MPTKVSELENDAKYITAEEVPSVSVPTKVSAFENDAQYITKADFDAIMENVNKTMELYKAQMDSMKEQLKKNIVYTVTLTADPAEDGTLTGAGSHNYESVVSLKAVAATGYDFVGWSDGVTDASRKITLLSDTDLVASFKKQTFTITLDVNDATLGTVSGAGTYEYGDEATIVATAVTGYALTHWSDGSTASTRKITVTENLSLTAVFEGVEGCPSWHFLCLCQQTDSLLVRQPSVPGEHGTMAFR